MTKAIISVGSNQGIREAHLNFAFAQIEKLPETKTVSFSRIYETDPIGGPEQGSFLNASVLIVTELEPGSLLNELQKIENAAGRVHDVRWGPRTLDLDIIDVENFASNTEELQVPHPRATSRRFVLQPILDLDANWLLAGKKISSWLEDVQSQKVSIWDGAK